MEILRRSSRARQKAATALNYGSSRSHSIFSLAVFGPTDADDAASDAGVRLSAEARLALIPMCNQVGYPHCGSKGRRACNAAVI